VCARASGCELVCGPGAVTASHHCVTLTRLQEIYEWTRALLLAPAAIGGGAGGGKGGAPAAARAGRTG
jgi:hypothetical protein